MVVVWGDETKGGDISDLKDNLTDIDIIYATRSAFAAVKKRRYKFVTSHSFDGRCQQPENVSALSLDILPELDEGFQEKQGLLDRLKTLQSDYDDMKDQCDYIKNQGKSDELALIGLKSDFERQKSSFEMKIRELEEKLERKKRELLDKVQLEKEQANKLLAKDQTINDLETEVAKLKRTLDVKVQDRNQMKLIFSRRGKPGLQEYHVRNRPVSGVQYSLWFWVPICLVSVGVVISLFTSASTSRKLNSALPQPPPTQRKPKPDPVPPPDVQLQVRNLRKLFSWK